MYIKNIRKIPIISISNNLALILLIEINLFANRNAKQKKHNIK